jgi:YD repeat-containing protein
VSELIKQRQQLIVARKPDRVVLWNLLYSPEYGVYEEIHRIDEDCTVHEFVYDKQGEMSEEDWADYVQWQIDTKGAIK